MKKLIPFLFIGLPVVADAQSQQQLIGSANYYYNPSGVMRTDTNSYYYKQTSAAGKPAFLPEVQRWNCDTVFSYNSLNELSARTLNSYSSGRLFQYFTDSRQSQGNWIPTSGTKLQYNANGKITEQELWRQVSGPGQLRPYQKETYSYNSDDKLTEYVLYWGDLMSVPTAFNPVSRSKYTYTGTQLTELLEENYTSGVWEPSMRTTFIYPIPTAMEEIVEKYNTTTTSWDMYAKTESALDANNRLTASMRQVYNGTTWENETEYAYTYDANGNMLTLEIIDWTSGSKENESKSEYTYNGDGYLLTLMYKRWDGAAYVMKDGSAATYNYYGFPTSIGNIPEVANDIAVYPNPAANTIGINMQAKGAYQAYLYDGMGKLVKATSGVAAGPHMLNMDVQSLPTGNYVLRVHANNSIASQKVVIGQ